MPKVILDSPFRAAHVLPADVERWPVKIDFNLIVTIVIGSLIAEAARRVIFKPERTA